MGRPFFTEGSLKKVANTLGCKIDKKRQEELALDRSRNRSMPRHVCLFLGFVAIFRQLLGAYTNFLRALIFRKLFPRTFQTDMISHRDKVITSQKGFRSLLIHIINRWSELSLNNASLIQSYISISYREGPYYLLMCVISTSTTIYLTLYAHFLKYKC